METFADYILNEKDFSKKLAIMYFLEKKTYIYFNKSVILKALVAKLFIELENIDVDKNLVITAALLCACKKSDVPQNLIRVKSYARESAEYLETLGFSQRFCKMCKEHNRYSQSENREKESDILELVDQFGGMILDRPERIGFKVDEAIILLEHRNLRGKDNRYLKQFINFVSRLEGIVE